MLDVSQTKVRRNRQSVRTRSDDGNVRTVRHSPSRQLGFGQFAPHVPNPIVEFRMLSCHICTPRSNSGPRSLRLGVTAPTMRSIRPPGQVTDIALQESEQLVGSGPVAAGDTVRWIIGNTKSGAGASRKVHILAKPARPDLMTNLIINTDRRTYLLELRSTEKTYMASVFWQYPQDQLIALRRQNAEAQAAAPIQSGIDITRLRFRYAIDGDDSPWRPNPVCGD